VSNRKYGVTFQTTPIFKLSLPVLKFQNLIL